MTTFAAKLKELSTAQLERLEQLLQQIETPGYTAALSASDEELVSARTYEISLDRTDADFDTCRAEALADYTAGKLKLTPMVSPPLGSPRSRQEPSQVARPPSALENASLASVGPHKVVPKAEEPRPKPKPDLYTVFGISVRPKPTLRLYVKAFRGDGTEL